MQNKVHRRIRALALSLAVLLSSFGIVIFGPMVPARAETGGYPFASYNGPGSNPSQYTWTDAKGQWYSDRYRFAYRNCTDFVAWKLDTANGWYVGTSMGHAKDWKAWAEDRDYVVDMEPKPGAVAWWNGNYGGGYGHVAWVESIDGNNVTIQEYNYDYMGNFNRRTIAKSSVSGYIHYKDLSGDGQSGYTPPPTIPWHFENLEGDGGAVGPHASDVGRTPAAIEFNGQLYVFHYDVNFGDLRYARTSPGWVFDILDGAGGTNGRTTSNVGQNPAAVVFNNKLHVFYFDAGAGNLRHAVSGDGVFWVFENLDGDWGSIGGLDGNIGQTPTAIVFGASLQVFYYDASRGNLRHAWWSGQWYFENLEGDHGSISHYDTNIGLDPTAVVHNGSLQLFYYDVTSGNLRHAWVDATGWHFENLDGDLGSVGRLNADVGGHPTAVVHQGNLHVFYYDITNGNFRHMWADAVRWNAENLEGDVGSISRYNGDVGTSSAAVVVGNTLQVFTYEAERGNLRHLLEDGTGWKWENFDGEGGGPAGRLLANVGLDPVAITFSGGLQLFYYDFEHGNLRHAMPQ